MSDEQEVRKVLIATPAYDGRLDVQIGTKKFYGNLQAFLERVKESTRA